MEIASEKPGNSYWLKETTINQFGMENTLGLKPIVKWLAELWYSFDPFFVLSSVPRYSVTATIVNTLCFLNRIFLHAASYYKFRKK